MSVGSMLGWAIQWCRSVFASPRGDLRRLAEARDGEHQRIKGIVEAVESVEQVCSPVDGSPCVAWRLDVERRATSRMGMPFEPRFNACESASRIGLVDGPASAIVEIGAEGILLLDDTGDAKWRTPEAELRTYLEDHGVHARGEALRFRELRVVTGDVVIVDGIGRWERDPEAPPRAGHDYRSVEHALRYRLPAPESGARVVRRVRR